MSKELLKQMFFNWNENGNTSFIGAGILFAATFALVLRLVFR